MSTESLFKFLQNLKNDFDSNTAEDKRTEYNLQTHTYTHNETVFVEEMIKELRSKGIQMAKNRKDEIARLAELFSQDHYEFLKGLNSAADKVGGITRLSGTPQNFSFIFTTDVDTGKPPTQYAGVNSKEDVFDKIKVSYSDAYRKFFFGVKNQFREGTKARERFKAAYNLRADLDIQSKGRMGHSMHAEGKGIIETMTREFFDNHASKVFQKNSKTKVLGEEALLRDLKKLKIDLSFMRDTNSMIQEISLGGAGGNIRDGQAVKKQLKAAKDRLNELVEGGEAALEMYELEGSDSFAAINRKKLLQKSTASFKTLKKAKLDIEDTKIKHSKKIVKLKSKSKGKRGAGISSVIKVKGLSSLGAKRKTPGRSIPSEMLRLIGVLNQRLPRKVRDNMQEPALQNRTGRFAESVKVTEVQRTPQGFPSVGYTYQKRPYEIFEVGRGQTPWATPERDPRKLIDRSIREIAAELAIGRFYTRRV